MRGSVRAWGSYFLSGKMAVSHIPVVDFSAMSLERKDPQANEEAVKNLADRVIHAFSTIGFVYLKNHGIPQESVESAFKTYDSFFDLSLDTKMKYTKKEGSSPNGWDALERETTNPERPGDLKESFDIGYVYDENFNWPNAEIPTFQKNVTTFYEHSRDLAWRVLSAMAIGLQLEPSTFQSGFSNSGFPSGGTQLRCNYYPLIEDMSQVKPGQLRCGEHTDYGAITLLFQDNAGGLEVSNVDGKFVPATPIEGTVLVNIGDLMQRWTSDKLKSTVHRVLIPKAEVKRRIPRRSLVFFVDPDYDTLITCLDGSDKYPPIKTGDWLRRKLLATYKY